MRGKEARRLQRIRRVAALRDRGTPQGSPGAAPAPGEAAGQRTPSKPSFSAAAPGADPYVGTILAERYRILAELGRGSMGTVYLGEHTALEKRVAVKVLAEEYAHLSEAVQRFFQEAKAASRIQHENIVAVTDFGRTPTGSVFLVMEYLEGRELAAALRDGGPMSPDRVRRIIMQLCDALTAAHSQGIIHRDMKPENVVLLDSPGRPDFVKIVDFGIARMNVLDRSASRLTCAGTVFGSPQYMAPEQARGEETDHRADIYAVGCIMYEMLTGSLPFRGTTVAALLSQHLFENPDPPRQRAPQLNIPEELEIVVLQAMEKERERRFQSMKEMAAALAVWDGTPGRPHVATPPPYNPPAAAVDVASILQEAQLALEDGLTRVALSLADRAVDLVGNPGASALQPWWPVMERIYLAACGDLRNVLAVSPTVTQDLDAQSAFLLSRVDAWMTLEDLLDISGMPRAVAALLVCRLMRSGALVVRSEGAATLDRAGAAR